jgi:hypothetical protein
MLTHEQIELILESKLSDLGKITGGKGTDTKSETFKHKEDMEKMVGLIDIFFDNSYIHIEDENSYFYIVAVKSAGFMNMNPCVYEIALEPEIIVISTYAREGLINQNTCEKAIKNIATFLKL